MIPGRQGGRERVHSLQAAGSSPIVLQPEKTFTIGRHDDCDLTIPSKRVSRLHAEIFWRSGLPVLKNLSEGSSTLVNGRAVDEYELRNRDELQVGPYRCNYQCTRGVPGAEGPSDSQLETVVDVADAAMKGTIETVPVADLLRQFEGQASSGTLIIRSGSSEAQIVFDQGGIHSASAGDLSGLQAVAEALGWSQGAFEFSLKKKTAPMKLIRKFDYAGDAPAASAGRGRDLKRIKISDLLDWYQGGMKGEPRARRRLPKPPRR